MERIENLEELLKDYIGSDKTILYTNVTNLTAPGENYLSDIVKIDVVLKNKVTNSNENLHLVAKLAIVNDIMGPTAHLTENELKFYQIVIPCIKRFHEKHNLPYPTFFPEFVAGRINLNGGEKADMDAVLVLENLQAKGYRNLDRHIGFDLETAKLILKDLATFHAVPLAMKILEPEEFDKNIGAICLGPQPPNFKNETSEDTDSTQPGLPPFPPAHFEIILEKLKSDEKCSEAAIRYENIMTQMKKDMRESPAEMFNREGREPFTTITHFDMWVNNTMQLSENGIPTGNKFVDYQMCKVYSPAEDLVFFLFSSVELSCLKKNMDILIDYYYKIFENILKTLNCYSSQFSYENFMEELKIETKHGFGQCMMMLPIIFGKKGHVYDLQKGQNITLEDMVPVATQRILYICEECTKRDWI